MLQNSVGDVPDLANVKQLSDQIVARGENQLGVEGYLELLLSACSTYDKKHASTRPPGQRNVYNVNTEMDDDGFYDANSNNDVFHVDTDVTDILAHSSNVRSQSSLTSRGSSMSSFIPKTEWMNMSPEQREEILAKRRKERGLQNNTQLS
jgi:hypothetical protein